MHLISVFIIPAILFYCTFCKAADTPVDLKINVLESIDVNGTKQWLLIRTNDTSKPVLLYLHGGPGQSLIPFAYVATKDLVNHFIVVYWDQRGTGLSLNEDIDPKTMKISQMIEDTHIVSEYLKKRFEKNKIILLGHSWGSTLGTFVINKYPDDYFAYIGVGQVVRPEEQERVGVEWLKKILHEKGSAEEKSKIALMEKRNFTDRSLLKKYGGVVHNIPIEKISEIMHNSPYATEKYTADVYKRGLKFASPLHEEVKTVDFFKQVPAIKIPVYFFLGKYDYVTPTEPVVRYFNLLKAPKKQIIWFEHSGHRIDIEESDKFQKEIMRISIDNFYE